MPEGGRGGERHEDFGVLKGFFYLEVVAFFLIHVLGYFSLYSEWISLRQAFFPCNSYFSQTYCLLSLPTSTIHPIILCLYLNICTKATKFMHTHKKKGVAHFQPCFRVLYCIFWKLFHATRHVMVSCTPPSDANSGCDNWQ